MVDSICPICAKPFTSRPNKILCSNECRQAKRRAVYHCAPEKHRERARAWHEVHHPAPTIGRDAARALRRDRLDRRGVPITLPYVPFGLPMADPFPSTDFATAEQLRRHYGPGVFDLPNFPRPATTFGTCRWYWRLADLLTWEATEWVM